MHKTQLKILELSARKNLKSMSLREIGAEIGVDHPQKVFYHMDQLKKRGLFGNKLNKEALDKLQENIAKTQESLLSIPILGAANCGIATALADESLEGVLRVSPRLILCQDTENLFALRAIGSSMNMANIKGESIDEGDYLIIDTGKSDPTDGDHVLSIIDGCANIKKFRHDGNRIILESESTDEFPPIFIHPEDDYLINGVVVQVIKKPKGGGKYEI